MSLNKAFATSLFCVVVTAAQFAAGQNCGCTQNYFHENVPPQMEFATDFGYPENHGGFAGHVGNLQARMQNHFREFHQHWEHTIRQAAKVEARNRAWPKPFACASRTLYAATMAPMIQAGFHDQATLGQQHFNAKNELNGLGKATISMIMTQMPIGQRNIYLARSADGDVNDARLARVRKVVETWYSTQSPQIVFSDRHINPGNGARYEILNRAYAENASPPVIPVATGTGGVGGGGN